MKLKKTRLLNNLSTKIALGIMLALPMASLHAETKMYGGLGVMASFVQPGDFTPFGANVTFPGNADETSPKFNTQMGGESFIGAMFGNFGAELSFTMKTLFADNDALLQGINSADEGTSIEANNPKLSIVDYTNMIQNGARISGIYKMNLGSFRPYVSAGIGTNVISGIPLSKPLWGFAVGGKIGGDFKLSDKMSIYAAYDLDATMSAKSKASDVISNLNFDSLKDAPPVNTNNQGYTRVEIPYSVNQLSEDLSKTFKTNETGLTGAYIIYSDTTPINNTPSLVTIQSVPTNTYSGDTYLEFPLEYHEIAPNSQLIVSLYDNGDSNLNDGKLAIKPLIDFSTQPYFLSNTTTQPNSLSAIVASSSTDTKLVTDGTKYTYAYIDDSSQQIYIGQFDSESPPAIGDPNMLMLTGKMDSAPSTVKYTYEELKTVLETGLGTDEPTKSKPNNKSNESKSLNSNKSTKATEIESNDNSNPLKFSSLLTHNIVVGLKFNF